MIDEAKSPRANIFVNFKRMTCIEDDSRVASDKWVVVKSFVFCGIFNDKCACVQYGVGAESDVSRCFLGIDSVV